MSWAAGSHLFAELAPDDMPIRLLLVDNHDSFTYNLFQMLAQRAGEPPIVVQNDAPWAQVRALQYDAVVLSPGPGHPAVPRDFGICRALIQEATTPLLGVCLGHQGIGAAWGAVVEPAPEVVHGRTSPIHHDGDPLFAGLPSPFRAVRYHSLAVDALKAPLVRIAWTDDGVLMGLRHRERPLWGVQFHPESICTEHGARLLGNFIDLARAQRRRAVSFPDAVHPEETQSQGPRDEPPTHILQTRVMDETPDAEAVFTALFAHRKDAFWLDSGGTGPGARFSFMGTGAHDGVAAITHRVGQEGHQTDSIFDRLRRGLESNRVDPSGATLPFVGGYVGYLGYEVKAECGAHSPHRAGTPDAVFLWVDRFLAFDHARGRLVLAALTPIDAPRAAEPWFDATRERLAGLTPPKPPTRPSAEALRLHRGAQYRADIARCLEEIQRGESYEVCLTTRLETEGRVEPFDFYRMLRRANPAPYAAYLRLGELCIAGSSPERFLRISADGQVEAKPIKGTRARGRTAAEDRARAEDLATSVKDRAENLMITDLLRNDLGRTCVVGSVHVPALMQVESYATVHQLVSTVRGRLQAGRDALDCVRAAFPAGSMTGAPKLRTMEIIDAVEGHARGVYSGALGYFGCDGAADLSVVIRTAVFTGDRVEIGVGGAIVALSDPEDEVAEILLKGRVLAEAMGSNLPGEPRLSEPVDSEPAGEGADSEGSAQ